MQVKELEQTTAIQILMYLRENREAKMTELMRELRVSQHPVYTALRVLGELGLIEDRTTSYPLKRIFTFTEKGRKVAEKLAEIEKILASGEKE